ncbi:MAG: 3-hydroxyanthranilate 3,4-dioxygenase, partial [Gammaproteobacteria bacterium]|nr:3-hydroxyanthranilate 3,4-dioxygenase [Gammaproteobacteria bacterium]
MDALKPLNFPQWIEDHRHLLKPPVGNRRVFEDGDFIIMVVGGPNTRRDYHVDPGQELFYQLEGEMVLKTMQAGRALDVPIRAGEMLLLPALVPHSPQRPAGTVGLVVERQRRSGERDGFQWYCP